MCCVSCYRMSRFHEAEVIRRWLETLLSLVVTLIGDEICIGYPLLVSGEYHSLSDTNTMMLLMLAELSL